ncbi:GlxA family transcriptional regulator, partial [Rhizobium brockwellii]
MTDAAQPFDIPVFVVVPPRVLLFEIRLAQHFDRAGDVKQ